MLNDIQYIDFQETLKKIPEYFNSLKYIQLY